MKIVVMGNNTEEASEVIFEAMKRWTMYKTLPSSVRDITYPDPKAKDISEDFLKKIESYNDTEKKLMYQNYVISSQYEKFKKEEFMFYNGCTIDVLIDAIIGNNKGLVRKEVVEKCIYYNKKLLRNIDAVYWLPDVDFWTSKVQEESDDIKEEDKVEVNVTLSEDDQTREKVYWNLLNEYQFNIVASPYFNEEDSPLFAMVEGDAVTAMSEIIGDNGRLAGDSISPEDEQKIQELLKKSPEYLQALKESIAGTRYSLEKQQ